MRKMLLICVLVPVAVAAVLPATASAATKRVKVGDEYFSPKRITIQSGDTVRWNWVGSLRHNVTVTRGPRMFHSKTQRSGHYSRAIVRRGTYRYICTIHPLSMRGRITVE